MRILQAPQDEFYGYRSAHVEDPFGHNWMIQTKIEEVGPQEMQKRLAAMMAAGPNSGAAKPKPASKAAPAAKSKTGKR